MNIIVEITDEMFGLKSVEFNNPKIRHGARGIVTREDGLIAVFNKKAKNEYKLPGGGIDEGENAEDAFKREVLEETGCVVNDIKFMGITKELKSLRKFSTNFICICRLSYRRYWYFAQNTKRNRRGWRAYMAYTTRCSR